MVDTASAPSATGTSAREAVRSILAVDFGSVHTRAVLFDEVDGQFRLIARAQALTTAEPPIADVSEGMGRALGDIGELVGRNLYNPGQGVLRSERSDTNGVDLFVATASGGRPLRAVVVGLSPDVSLISGQRALASTYIEVVDTVVYASAHSVEDNVNAILSKNPDLIMVVGGTNFGATEPVIKMLNTIQLAVSLARGKQPAVLYAGNEALRPLVSKMLSDKTSLFLTSNVRPGLDEEKLDAAELELALVYGEHMTLSVGGFADIQRASPMGLLATGQSYSNVIRYLGQLPGNAAGVVCVDVGGSTTMVCSAINRKSVIDIRTDLGLGYSAITGMQAVGYDNVRRWLSFEASDADLMDYAWNKSLRPSTVPQTGKDLEIEYALARELIRLSGNASKSRWGVLVPFVDVLPPIKQIIGAGSVLAQTINPGISALLLLDALQPVDVVRIQLDPYGVIAALGTLAYMQPLATVQVLENGGLLDVGTAICPTGKPPANGVAITATINFPSGQSKTIEIMGGTVKAVSLPIGLKAQVHLRMRGLRINGKSNLTVQVDGGASGLIFDARGRPFAPPTKFEDRLSALPAWYAGVRGETN
ncbi:MAG: glutamate mutase L [Anaerolineae bacterium]|nr:glutamate mutase L [Anaerolineae bacterium]